MLIQQKSGNIQTAVINDRNIDLLSIEWYETNKRILHKKTGSGIPVSLKFMQANPDLKEGDILWEDEKKIIAVEINTCACIVITPVSMLNACSFCFEIGNHHLPLYYDGDQLLVPFEQPLYNLLQASGYQVEVEERKPAYPVKTSVLPHLQTGSGNNIFNKILRLTTSS
jgi:urease accessory protein